MPMEYTIVRSLRLAYARAWGRIDIDDILQMGTRLFSDQDWETGFNVLLDYRDIEHMDIQGREVRQIIDLDKANKAKFKGSKCAVVSDLNHVFGLSRMWQIMSDGVADMDSMVFRNLSQALDWLGLKPNVLDSIRLPS